MRKNIFLLILLILAILLSSAAYSYEAFGVNFTRIVIDENFEYINSFTSRNWTFSNVAGCSQTPATPFDSSFSNGGSYVFGQNHNSIGCSANYVQIARYDLGTFLDNRVLLDFDFYVGTNHTLTPSYYTIAALTCDVSGNTFTVNFVNSTSAIDIDSNLVGGQPCTTVTNLTRDQYNNITLDINLNDLYYTLYINGRADDSCSFIYTGTNDGTDCIDGVRLRYRQGATSTINNMMFDNLILATTQTESEILYASNLSIPGEPCNRNDECVTGLCEYHSCVRKRVGMGCTYDYECMSGECLHGSCTKESYFDMIDATKDQQFGDDENTNNALSMIFMIGVVVILIWWGGKVGALASIPLFYVMGFFFTIIGWLSVFILVGFIIAGLIVAVLLFMLKGSSD